MLPSSIATAVSTAREVATTIIAEHAEEEDREARWPAHSMRALAEAGLMGLQVPRELDGHGLGLAALAAVAEALGEHSASTALCYAMHCVGTAVIAAKPTDAQRERYLVPIAQGRHITTLALSEPGSGVFFYYPETSLSRRADGYSVRGTKCFVTNGGHADSYVVSTTAVEDDAPEGTFSCVLVDAGLSGIGWQAPWQGLGMRGNSSRSVSFEDVHVPAENLLGAEGDQLWYVFEVVAPYFLMAMAGTYLGVAQAAFDEARSHLSRRRYSHSGEVLGHAPVLAHRLGSLWTELEQTRALIYSAAIRADENDPDALAAVLGSKAVAANAAVNLTNEAMTLCGGSAYAANSRLARLLRDARASHVMAPSTDVLQTWVGRTLLKLPLL